MTQMTPAATDTVPHEQPSPVAGTAGPSLRLRFYRLLRRILLGFITVSIINVLFSYFFYTPKMYRIYRDNRELVIKYRILQERIRTARQLTDEIRQRDNQVYRTLFSTDTLAMPAVWQEYGAAKYAPLADDPFADLMIPTWKQLDAWSRQLYLASVSFDELQLLARDKEKMTTAIPAMWPIDRRALHNNNIGAFNPRRFHPTLHRIRPHYGVDFGADRGTPIYATGDAVVELAQPKGNNGGFGHQVLLNHGFGYKTRYAHMDRVDVARGDTIRRGQQIGTVGNTGISSGAHLHYEVIYKGRPVNPINYFDRNITEAEYERLMKQIRESKYEL